MLNQAVEQRLRFCPSDLPELQGLKVRHCNLKGRLINLHRGRSSADQERMGILLSDARKCDMTLPVQLQHQTPAYHVPECTVGLHPTPGFTQLPGESPAAVLGMLRDELPDKGDVLPRKFPTSVSNQRFHGQDIP